VLNLPVFGSFACIAHHAEDGVLCVASSDLDIFLSADAVVDFSALRLLVRGGMHICAELDG